MKLPLDPNARPDDSQNRDGEPVWMVVASTSGVTEAAIIAGRLNSLGIPTMIHRESVSLALPLTFGVGQALVVVPEKFYEVAKHILEPLDDNQLLEDGDFDDFDDDDFGEFEDADDDNQPKA